jgi:hypothetical protein
MTTVHMAQLTTPNFEFSAIAATAPGAAAALMRTWAEHCKQTGARLSYMRPEDVTVQAMELEAGYRDGQLLCAAPASCRRCGSGLVAAAGTTGVCSDETCPYSDYPQGLDVEMIAERELTRSEVNALIEKLEGPTAPGAYRRNSFT